MIKVNLHGSKTAACELATITGSKAPICELARLLLERDLAAADDLLEVWRGSTLCFSATPIEWWAGRSIRETDQTPICAVKYEKFDVGKVWG